MSFKNKLKSLKHLSDWNMRSILVLILISSSVTAMSQVVGFDAVLNRYERNGTAFPQEKVYVHMDNTCYFVGDTIWYAAYLLRTDKDTPSNISRVLYVELLTSDGYLAERQLVEMNEGRGHGCFALHDSYHGGFYELRAYTRWQLNWGRTEHQHAKEAGVPDFYWDLGYSVFSVSENELLLIGPYRVQTGDDYSPWVHTLRVFTHVSDAEVELWKAYYDQ